MGTTKVNTLRVPGANLYYEVRGSGPVLLLIHAGGGDADGFNGLADRLADRYTVVTYDRRGYSRSKLDNPTEEYLIETHSEDAYRLLKALASEPVYVFGSSAGALVGLDLVARHPDQVRMLVAHEPPAQDLLPAVEQTRLKQTEEILEETVRREGPASAMRKLTASLGVETEAIPHPSADNFEGQRMGNVQYFVGYEVDGIRHYKLDLTVLKTASPRILPAGGVNSRGAFPYLCAVALANCLATEIAEFPGHHAGYVIHPMEFAERLHEVIGDCRRS